MHVMMIMIIKTRKVLIYVTHEERIEYLENLNRETLSPSELVDNSPINYTNLSMCGILYSSPDGG